MKVPLLDLGIQLRPLREEIIAAVTGVIDSTTYIQGPEVAALENEIAEYCGVSDAVGVSSGTDALLVSLMGLGVGVGDRVLTTAYSFFATMGVILRLGAKPVFADIDPVSFNIDPASMAKMLAEDKGQSIKAIIPVHLYGQCAKMTEISELAGKYNIPVIEDAAQAIGAEYPDGQGNWSKAGTMGLAGCFSFFPSKNLGGIGDGGMVITDDHAFAEKLRLLRNHGASPKYYHSLTGGNFRLDPVQAVVLRIKLRHLESWHQARRANAQYYDQLFSKTSLPARGLLKTPAAVYDGSDSIGRNYHIYNQFVIRAEKRDKLVEYLHENNIGCEIYYPVCLHEQKCLHGIVNSPTMVHAEEAARTTLALPIYPELQKEMQEYVVEKIVSFYS